MKNNVKPGDEIIFSKTVTSNDFAEFNGETIHRVYSTYALARDFEWTTRQFVIKCKDEGEEGIGTRVHVEHKAPAFEGDEIVFKGYIAEINGNELICSVVAYVKDKAIATGITGQKILTKSKLEVLLKRNG